VGIPTRTSWAGARRSGPGWADDEAPAEAAEAVAALYGAHAVGLIRLAVVMLGDRAAAEDVVQDAFCGLYRRWGQLADTAKALGYVRACTLNGCRSELRQRLRAQRRDRQAPAEALAEAKAETRRYAKRQIAWFNHQTADWPRVGAREDAAAVGKILRESRS